MKRLSKKEKRFIKPLPERVINKIAAGEVIERPAAVVKELVENSIDAGADNIEIFIEKSGAKLIKIVDNGCGIPEEQIEIAFSRHATSKIRNFDELNALYSYGFRGEALPSIASISRLRMVSRPYDAAVGVEIIYEGGVLQSKQPIAAAFGTTIEIENLFYNTPARRKFLKAESTETRHISRNAMGMALSRHDIGFSFTSNNKLIFSLPKESTLKDRALAVLGQDKKLIRISGEEGPVKLEGYIGTPEMVQQNRYGQFLFINNRYIQSPTIAHAFSAGYKEMMPRGKFPIGVLLLEVDVSEVDVNVHPTKAEVRLSQEREIHDAVYRIIKETLRSDGIIPSFPTSTFSSHNQTSSSSPHTSFHNQQGGHIQGLNRNEAAHPNLLQELYRPLNAESTDEIETVQVDKQTGEIIQVDATASETLANRSSQNLEPPPSEIVSLADGFRLVGRFADLYLLLQAGKDLYIIDQHTAHERILFEENITKVDNSSIEGQAMLFPVQIELDPQQFVLFEESAEMLNKSGFDVSPFGGRTVNINAIPAILKKKSPEKMFLRILDDIASLKESGYDLKKAMAQSIACRSAVMAGDRLTDKEATHLLTRLLECKNMYACPHGRPTFIKISRQDLDRQFGRA